MRILRLSLSAEVDGQIVGLIDVGYEEKERTVCSREEGVGGMIWHIAVHPDYSRKKSDNNCFMRLKVKPKKIGVNRLEAWTRDDLWVQDWYKK
ncbi:hypothetical protein [Sporosarcina sp. Te-1]|uniref:hypothetical protein n=1 Tax=Sporosarcina sp. Te-1 TaxID=2818390 RepID=UPI001FB18CB6|nr:hypothetical protein [Sporosarcina sp. Te-1]